jgi:hypothetical protein
VPHGALDCDRVLDGEHKRLADEAAREEKENVDEMSRMIRAMLARQLLSVIDAAGPIQTETVPLIS